MITKRLYLLLVSAFLCACSSLHPTVQPDGRVVEDEDSATRIRLDNDVRQELNITVAPAEELPVGTPVVATGQLQINEDASWVVGSMTDGKIVSVPVRVGDAIREGQVLAVLHSHEVHDARATLRQARSELARQKVLEEQARMVLERTRRLFNLRAASREQLEAAETAYISATNNVAAAQAEVDKAAFHVTDYLEVPLEPPAEGSPASTRDGLTIKSPASGTLMDRHATAGTVVSAGDPVFTIANLSSLWLIASVNEADMARVRPGQAVKVRVRAYMDRAFPGMVLRLGERLDPQTRTLQVRVLVPNTGGLLKPDMFATAEFESGDVRTTLQVPEAAVQQMNGKYYVFLSNGNDSFEPQEVGPGAIHNGRVEIRSGLKAGDVVAVNGAYLLKTQVLKATGE